MPKDALYFAAKIRNNETTAIELVEAAIQAIEEGDGQLNAVIHRRFDEARAEAINKTYSEGPFAGVPILIKGLGQDFEGLPSTAGAKLLAENVASTTSNFVKRIQEMGFIILGQTNVPEYGFKNITDSQLYGHARNFHDSERTPGGSSGGSAAALAAGWVPVAAASDGGGSIRIPASFSGLIGFKPSRGNIVVGPGGMRGWSGASVNFFLTRSIRDTKALLTGVQAHQPEAPFNLVALDKEFTNLKDLRIAYTLQSPVGGEISKEAVAAVEKTLDYFTQQGAQITEVTPNYDGRRLMEAYFAMNGGETAAMFNSIQTSLNRPLTYDDMEPMTWAIYQYGQKIPSATYIESLSIWDDAATEMTQLHANYDVFITPTTAFVAPLIDELLQTPEIMARIAALNEGSSLSELKQVVWDMFEKSLDISPFTQLANLTGQPAISLPVYKNEVGLPMGVQLMALKGADAFLLALAEQMESDQLLIF